MKVKVLHRWQFRHHRPARLSDRLGQQRRRSSAAPSADERRKDDARSGQRSDRFRPTLPFCACRMQHLKRSMPLLENPRTRVIDAWTAPPPIDRCRMGLRFSGAVAVTEKKDRGRLSQRGKCPAAMPAVCHRPLLARWFDLAAGGQGLPLRSCMRLFLVTRQPDKKLMATHIPQPPSATADLEQPRAILH